MGYGTWLHGSIILLNFLSYGDDLNGLNMLLPLCYFITYGCWYMWWYLSLNIYAMSMVIWLHSASTYISFSDSNCLMEWYHVDDVISHSISFTFCYISGHLLTFLQQRSHTHIRSRLSLNKIKFGHLKLIQNEPNTPKDPPAGPNNT